MRTLRVTELEPGTLLRRPLYHESGFLLLAEGQRVTDAHLESLRKADIEQVVQPESEEDVRGLLGRSRKMELSVSSLEVGRRQERDLYDEDGMILLAAGKVLKDEHLDIFERRGLRSVFVYRDTAVDAMDRYTAERGRLLIQQLEDGFEDNADVLHPPPVAGRFEKLDQPARVGRSREEREAFLRDREAKLESVRELFDELHTGRALSGRRVETIVDDFMDRVRHDVNLMLVLSLLAGGPDHLPQHSLATCSLSLALGAAWGLDDAGLRDLGKAGLLHDVGMLKVPRSIVDKPGKLTTDELREIQKHPAHGVDLLQQVDNVSPEVAYVVYQTHEREGGKGYPRGRRGEQTHDYAKMIAVCDVYNALCSDRPHRKARLPYEAMALVVKMAGPRLGMLNKDIVRTFLRLLGLFPVGSWVRLESGERARVASGTGEEYAKPLLYVLFDRDGRPLAEPWTVNLAAAGPDAPAIAEAIPPPAQDDGTLLGL